MTEVALPASDSLVLGIETSCDECSASIVSHNPTSGLKVRSVSTFSQIDIHRAYGGVVPEIASRNHLETINVVIKQSLEEAGVRYQDLNAIAVTNRPGLVGALLVGVTAAKALAYAFDKPLIPVHHLHGHAVSLYLDHPEMKKDIQYPLLLAIVSGGHSNLYVLREPPEKWNDVLFSESLIGRSVDDAAGEAFDKSAKVLGFPYPGGVWIEKYSQGGNPAAFDLPRALPQKTNFNFSFSGVKTAVSLLVAKLKKEDRLEDSIPNLCASIQEAIVDALTRKISLAVKEFNCRSLAIVGGVSANQRLRTRLHEACAVPAFFPHMKYCTDNAAMIAAAGMYSYLRNESLSKTEMLKLNAFANPSFTPHQ